MVLVIATKSGDNFTAHSHTRTHTHMSSLGGPVQITIGWPSLGPYHCGDSQDQEDALDGDYF